MSMRVPGSPMSRLWAALVWFWRGQCWFGKDALDMDDYASPGHWHHVKHHTCPPEVHGHLGRRERSR